MATNTPTINYTNRDFSSIKSNLVNLVKTYYPNTLIDFSPSSPAMMLIDSVSYVGDVLSFYTDVQLQETLLEYAQENKNINNIAYTLGYRPNATAVSIVQLYVYQVLPADQNTFQPLWEYALNIPAGAQIQSVTNSSINFVTQDVVNFAISSSLDPTTVTVYSTYVGTTNPQLYLIRKSVTAISQNIKTVSFNFGAPTQFPQVVINDTNITNIISCTDTQGNSWYEVPYLAQSTIFQPVLNNLLNSPNFSYDNNNAPYLLTLKKVDRRFATRFLDQSNLQIEFGAGVTSSPTEEIIPNPNNVGMGLVDGINKLNIAYDPSNFLYTNEYGVSPTNTTLTFTYGTGGGVISNLPSDNINVLKNFTYTFNGYNLDSNLQSVVVKSLTFNNPSPSSGGGPGDSVQQIRLNAISNFSTQLRNVTKEDYLVRTLSMPPKFGYIAKAYVQQDNLLSVGSTSFIENNPLALSIYVLSVDINGKLTTASDVLKQNLATYLSYYKIGSDAVNIKDGFTIDIGCNFSISVAPNFNGQQVLTSCLTALYNYFDVSNWQINEPIIINDIYNTLSNVQGVLNVLDVEIVNLFGGLYSQYAYSIQAATQNGVIYPSLDPSMFYVRFPNQDIQGRVV